jgi:hypothetical protein
MEDLDKVWTTVGSAGTLNQVDLAKVTLDQSIIQLGTELLPPPAVAVAGASPTDLVNFPTIQAVVRYNVTSVDGLFKTGLFAYRLRLRCRGQISAKLIEVDLASGMEKRRIKFDSNNHNDFEDQDAFDEDAGDPPQSIPFDFNKKAYYVEATLTASAVAIGHPAAISTIQISAPTPTK